MSLIDGKEFIASGATVTAFRPGLGEQRRRPLSSRAVELLLLDLDANGNFATLADLYELATGSAAHGLDRAGLIQALVSSAEEQRLVFVEGWRSFGDGEVEADKDGPADAVGKLVREVMGAKSELSFEGRRYRIVSSAGEVRAAAAKEFRVLDRRDALLTLKRMATRLPASAAERTQWTQLLALSTEHQDGGRIAVLRHVPTSLAIPTTSSEPALTPSQLRQAIAPDHWFEVTLLYDTGEPFDQSCVLQLPDGKKTEGPPGAGGVIRVDGMPSAGTCSLGLSPSDDETITTADADVQGAAA